MPSPPCSQFGYYSLLAASMGCRSIAWEPVPYFAAYFKYALLLNNFTHAVEVGYAVAAGPGSTVNCRCNHGGQVRHV